VNDMKIPCSICSERGTVEQGRPCPACGGSGEIEAPEGFHMSEAHKVAMFRMVVDILDKCNDTLDKCNDIFEKVNE